MRGIRVGMRRMRVGMQRIKVELLGISVEMRRIESNRNRKKRKKVYKIQFSFFPEIEKKNEIRIVMKR